MEYTEMINQVKALAAQNRAAKTEKKKLKSRNRWLTSKSKILKLSV